MQQFMDDDFLLNTQTAKRLYHKYAGQLPLIDYHCHLSPKEIYEDRTYENITQLWLGADHYKWRLMRADGVDEKYITGDASDEEKFEEWVQTIESAWNSGNSVNPIIIHKNEARIFMYFLHQ